MIKALLITIILISQQAYAGCEATIIEGSHTAIMKQEALAGAWEDVTDLCYPGEATKLEDSCEQVPATVPVPGGTMLRCVQKASCTVCGDDLARKYQTSN